MRIRRSVSGAVALLTAVVSWGALAPGVASAAGGRLAYGCRAPMDICTADGDASGAARLLNDASTDSYPAWSPDGSQIAFQRGASLSVMRADGTGLRALTPVDEWRSGRISWAPDGRRLAFTNANDIYVVGVDGTGLVKVTNGEAHVVDADPAWSPDGTKIAFRTDRDRYGCWTQDFSTWVSFSAIYVMNADGTGATRVTPAQNPATLRLDSYAWPEWSPGSSSTPLAAYNRMKMDLRHYPDVNQYACAGPELREMVVDGVARPDAGFPSLSSDGKVAYSLGGEVYVAPRSSGTPVRIGPGAFPDWRPAAAPPPPAACADGRDNDADGKSDYPADPGCASASDNDERGLNVLKNPDFELDANADGRPDAWTSSPRFTRSSTTKLNGAWSGRHLATDNSSYTVSQAVGGVVAGRSYRVTGNIAIPATSDTFTFRVLVRWRDASNVVVGTSTIGSSTAATTGWVPLSASVPAPAGATSAVVQMTVTSLNATIYADRFAFQVA